MPAQRRVLQLSPQMENLGGLNVYMHHFAAAAGKLARQGGIQFEIIGPVPRVFREEEYSPLGTEAGRQVFCRKDSVLSAAAGMPVYHARFREGVPVTVADASAVPETELAGFLAENYSLFGLHSLGWEKNPATKPMVQANYAMYRLGKALLGTGKYDAVRADDWLGFDAGLRLKHESGLPLFAFFHTTEKGNHCLGALGGISSDIVSRENAALEHGFLCTNDPDHAAYIIKHYVENNPRLELGERRKDCRAYMRRLERARASGIKTFAVQSQFVIGDSNTCDFSGVQAMRIGVADVLGERAAMAAMPAVSGRLLGERKLVGFMGRVQDPRKGAADVLNALSKLPWEYAGVFTSIGTTDQDRTAFSQAATAAGVADRVVLDSNPLSEKRKMLRLVAVDANVLPSKYEPSGIVFFEAACATSLARKLGLSRYPALLTTDKATTIMGANCVIHVADDYSIDAPSLATEIRKAVEDGNERERLAQGCDRIALAGWTWERHVEEFNSFANRLLAAGEGSAPAAEAREVVVRRAVATGRNPHPLAGNRLGTAVARA